MMGGDDNPLVHAPLRSLGKTRGPCSICHTAAPWAVATEMQPQATAGAVLSVAVASLGQAGTGAPTADAARLPARPVPSGTDGYLPFNLARM
jgi:hypothetical protein